MSKALIHAVEFRLMHEYLSNHILLGFLKEFERDENMYVADRVM